MGVGDDGGNRLASGWFCSEANSWLSLRCDFLISLSSIFLFPSCVQVSHLSKWVVHLRAGTIPKGVFVLPEAHSCPLDTQIRILVPSGSPDIEQKIGQAWTVHPT